MSKLNRIFFAIVALVILSPVASFAQAFTNVTATVVDSASNPYRNCFYNIDYVNQSTIVRGATVGGTSPFQQSVSGRCDSFGSFSTRLASNSAIQPAPSQWKFSICDSTNVICFNTLITISGGSQDVSVVLSAASAPLVNAIGFPYINFATTALPPTPISGAVFWFDGTRFRCKTSAGLTTCGPNSNPQDRGYISVMSDCPGVVGDGVTDDYAAIQACLDANQDRVIMFPKLRAAGSLLADYFSSNTLIIHGHGTSVLGGGGRPRWFNAVTIKYPTSVVMFRLDFDCTNCSIDRLAFQSADLFISTDLKTWPDWTLETQFRGTSSLDGIQILGGEWTIGDVHVVGAKGNCLQVIGQGTGGQPDLGKLNGFMYDGCRAYGAYMWGADSNVAIYQSENFWFNLMGASRDISFYANTRIAPHASGNARDPGVVAGANKVITGEVVNANVKTITATAHGWVVDQWVTTTAEVDGTFAGTCKLTSIVDANNARCNFNHADGSTTGGTGATSSSTQVIAYYTAHGLAFNTYTATSVVGCGTFIQSYIEGNSGTPDYGCAVVIGAQGIGNVASGNRTGSQIMGASGPISYWSSGAWTLVPNTSSNSYFQIMNFANSTSNVSIKADTGDYQSIGKIRIRTSGFTFAALNDGLELPNGILNGIAFRNNAGSANVRSMYLDPSDVTEMPNTNGYIFAGPISNSSTLQITGLSTLTGGMKAGASGSTIADSRKLIQDVLDCGTTTTCGNTSNLSDRIVRGTVALSSGTPSTAVVSSITAFTSTSSYNCTLTNMTNAANNLLKVVNTSTTSFTITGPNTITDTISYICIGH